MEKVTSGDPAATASLRTANAVERKERGQFSIVRGVVGRGEQANALPIAAVAAQAEEGKYQSLSTLANVTQSIDDAVEVLNQALSPEEYSGHIRTG